MYWSSGSWTAYPAPYGMSSLSWSGYRKPKQVFVAERRQRVQEGFMAGKLDIMVIDVAPVIVNHLGGSVDL
jgi:hypothetical protein